MRKTACLCIIALVCVTVFACATVPRNDSTAQTQAAQISLNNGKRLFDQADYDGAIQELNEAIRLDPNLAEAYAYRARSYSGKGDYDQGLSDANKAIQLNSKLSIGYYARGNVYRNKNDYDRAIADYTEVIMLDHNYVNAYFNRGLVYYNKKDYDRAITDYTEAIRINPNFVEAYINRGVAYGEKKDYDRAIVDYEAALKINPNNTTARNNLSNAQQMRTLVKTKDGVSVTLISTSTSSSNAGSLTVSYGETRATFLVENTTSQTKRLIIVLEPSYYSNRGTPFPSQSESGGLQNSPEYTLAPNEKRQVVVSTEAMVQDSSGTQYVNRSGSVSVREIIVN